MATYRDPSGRLWHVPAQARAQLDRKRRELVRLAGSPGTDPDTIRRGLEEMARLARRLFDVVLSPIDIIDDIVRHVKGAPTMLLVAAALYYATKTEHRRRPE